MHLNSVAPSLNNASSNGEHPAVIKGEEIGKVGHSGAAASGDHLHFELRVGTWCSLEFQLANPSSSCSGYGFDPAMNSLLLLPEIDGNINLTLDNVPSVSADGQITYTSSPDSPLLNRIDYKIVEKSSKVQVKNHILDFNLRSGFDPSSTAFLDTPDKTKPYMSPESFGVDKNPYTTHITIPSSYAGNYDTDYSHTLTAINIWGKTVTLTW